MKEGLTLRHTTETERDGEMAQKRSGESKKVEQRLVFLTLTQSKDPH
jgi:hypothetical protein